MINPNTVARIKACKGVYSVGDTANYFNVSKRTVHDIWMGKRHEAVRAATEPANIKASRVSREIVLEDARVLLARGMSVVQAAAAVGVGKTTLYDTLREEGVEPCYFF